jgi:monolysocardiolipin acyltransferase
MSGNGKANDKNINWPSILPLDGKKSSATRLWRTASAVVVPSVAVMSKIWLNWCNTTRIKNQQIFLDTLNDHFEKKSYPLVTVSNHHSCLDDPGLWGSLFPWKWILNSDRHRWSAAAEDICFTKTAHSVFFALGKTFPVIRGDGIHQKGVDYAIDLMRNNAFIHFFPQGRTVDDHQEPKQLRLPSSMSDEELRQKMNQVTLRDNDFDKGYELKWGLARAIMDVLGDEPSRRKIMVLPFYHLGMNHALPNGNVYIPRLFKNIHIFIREAGAIQFDHEYLKSFCFNGDTNIPIALKRSLVMKRFEEELKMMKLKAIQFQQTLEE